MVFTYVQSAALRGGPAHQIDVAPGHQAWGEQQGFGRLLQGQSEEEQASV